MITRAEAIALRRRQQPISELERKAKKAGRRPGGFSEEAKDLMFARAHGRRMSFRAELLARDGAPTHYCFLCGRFGSDWDEASGSYRGPVRHSERCSLNPVAPTIYAGTLFTGCVARPKGRLP